MRTVHEMPLHLLRVLELLHEARMFPYSRNVEGLHLGTDGEDEVVIGYRRVGDCALNLRGICRNPSIKQEQYHSGGTNLRTSRSSRQAKKRAISMCYAHQFTNNAYIDVCC